MSRNGYFENKRKIKESSLREEMHLQELLKEQRNTKKER